MLLVWDNASWHDSQIVRAWLRQHNRRVKQTGQGVRLIACALPSKSPWLNPIKPKWLAGKKRVVAPDRPLSAAELEDRVCAVYDCPHEPHLVAPRKALLHTITPLLAEVENQATWVYAPEKGEPRPQLYHVYHVELFRVVNSPLSNRPGQLPHFFRYARQGQPKGIVRLVA